MNKEDIIRMAKEADLVSWLPNSTFSDGIWWIEAHEVGSELERFAALVASSEREACAKVAEEWSKRPDDVGGYIYRNIRARGQA